MGLCSTCGPVIRQTWFTATVQSRHADLGTAPKPKDSATCALHPGGKWMWTHSPPSGKWMWTHSSPFMHACASQPTQPQLLWHVRFSLASSPLAAQLRQTCVRKCLRKRRWRNVSSDGMEHILRGQQSHFRTTKPKAQVLSTWIIHSDIA